MEFPCRGGRIRTRQHTSRLARRQADHRIVRSILSWEACDYASRELDTIFLMKLLASRETAKAEDMMRGAVVTAQKKFNELYMG